MSRLRRDGAGDGGTALAGIPVSARGVSGPTHGDEANFAITTRTLESSSKSSGDWGIPPHTETRLIMSKVKVKKVAATVAEAPIAVSETPEVANSKLADFSKEVKRREAAAAETAKPKRVKAAKKIDGLPDLPKLPAGKRKPRPGKPCECGCAQMTGGGRFLPGHDARLHAWALRVERGILKAADVPEPHTAAVKALIAGRRKAARTADGAEAE